MADTVDSFGKPTGQDEARGRPSAARELGLRGAVKALAALTDEIIASVPECPGQAHLQAAIRAETKQFLPRELALMAA